MHIVLVGEPKRMFDDPNPPEPYREILPDVWRALDHMRSWISVPRPVGTSFVQRLRVRRSNRLRVGIAFHVHAVDELWALKIVLD